MLYVDRRAQFPAEYETLLHIDQNARFEEEFLTLLERSDSSWTPDFVDQFLTPHIHQEPWFRAKFLTLLHVDRNAQFCVEHTVGFFGIFSKKIYRFHCWQGTRGISDEGFWTEEQYQVLLTQQQEEPVRVLTDWESGRTWWMFRDKFYWEDYSAREVVDKQRSESVVFKEVTRVFFEGTSSSDGITGKMYRFPGWLSEQEIEFWTEEQYQTLLAQQAEKPVRVLTDWESGRTWWMFRDGFYWEDCSARGVVDRQRPESAFLKEVTRTFFEGASSSDGTTGKMYRRSAWASERVCLPVRSWLSEGEIGSWTEEQYQALLARHLPGWLSEQKRLPVRSWLSEGEIGFWTEQQYKALLAKQQKEFVLFLMGNKINKGSWWMFQDQLYWAWVDEDLKEDEAKRLFTQGARSPDGIASETSYRFQCKQGGRGIHACRILTEEEYQALLAKQQEELVLVRIDSESGIGSGTWWMFQGKFYFAKDNLRETEIRTLFVEGSRSPEGIGRRRYRFLTEPPIFIGREEIQYGKVWTEEEYQALLAKQQDEPVRILSDRERGRTWWVFQDKFYWSWSNGVFAGRFWTEDELERLFFEGGTTPEGIGVATAFRFQCQLKEREIQSDIVWSAEQYQALLAQQREDPVNLLTDWESGKTWWMFRDKFYWEDDDLDEIAVKALLLEQIRKKESKIERAIRLMENEGRPHTYREPLPSSVKLLVWERDQGRCVQCSREEELEYDHIIPVSKGGSNTENNIQLLCAACNRSKGANLV